MREKLFFSMIIAALVFFVPTAFAQSSTAADRQIPQSILVNGQTAQGVLVVHNGTVQTYSCQYPQQYVTADGTESGWACFDQGTGQWLLHAQPGSNAEDYGTQQSVVYNNSPNTVYVPPTYAYGDDYPSSYSYGYPYPYYPYYGYPYGWPGLGFGLGFAFGNSFNNGHFHGGNFNNFHGGNFHGGHGVVVGPRGNAFVSGPHGNFGVVHGNSGFHGGGFNGGGFHGGGFHGGGGGFHGGGGGFHGGGFGGHMGGMGGGGHR
jgi:hypothetical protein